MEIFLLKKHLILINNIASIKNFCFIFAFIYFRMIFLFWDVYGLIFATTNRSLCVNVDTVFPVSFYL